MIFALSRKNFYHSLNCPAIYLYKMRDIIFGVEVCEDLWVAASPSVEHAKHGATIICNPSTSDDVIGKAQYRRDLVKMQSGKLCCAYIYSDSGFGESTTDMVISEQIGRAHV